MATTTQHQTIVGVFNSVQDAQEAVRELESNGISRDDISIVANKNAVGYENMDETDRNKTADVVADAGIGAAIGGVGGLLLSAAGAITIPVIGPILAAGPIAAALTGAGIGAAAGGLIGALTESGIPEEDAKHYAEGVRRGDVLVTVKADRSRAERISDVLERHNAVDVDDRVRDWRQRGWSGYREDAQPFTDEELRTERRHYGSYQQTGDIMGTPRSPSGSTLTGQEGMGVERERSSRGYDRDKHMPDHGRHHDTTPVASGSSLTGEQGVGVDRERSSRGYDRDKHMHDEHRGDATSWSGGTVSSGGTADQMRQPIPNTEAGNLAGDIGTSGIIDTTGRPVPMSGSTEAGTERHEDVAHRVGDEVKEWGRDVKEFGHELRRGAEGSGDEVNQQYRETRSHLSSTDPGRPRGDTGNRMRDNMEEMGRDLKEAGRDTRDVLTGRTGTQPHDVREDAREAERRRRVRIYDRI